MRHIILYFALALVACGAPTQAAILGINANGAIITQSTLAACGVAAGVKECRVTSVLSAVQSNISSSTVHEWPTDRELTVSEGGSVNPTTLFRVNGLAVAGMTGPYNSSLADYSRTLQVADIITGSPWVDVRKYMDGQSGRPTLAEWQASPTTVNVAACIQSAIDEVYNAGGGTVFFPKGFYLIPTGLTIAATTDKAANIRITGAGAGATWLKTSTATDILTISTTTGNMRRVTIDNIGFNANHASARSLVLTNAAYNQFSNLDFIGGGTAIVAGSASTDANQGNQFMNIRMTQVGRGIVVNGRFNQFTNLQINEGISGPDAIYLNGEGNQVTNFVVRGVSGTGGTATVVITSSGADCMLSTGRVFDSYAIGIAVAGARNVKIDNVNVQDSATHGVQFSSSLQPYFSGTIQGSSASSPGTYHHLNIINSVTDGIFHAAFVGTGALLDISEASTSGNNQFYAGTLPNGYTSTSSTGSVAILAGVAYKINLGPLIAALTAKTTPVDADALLLMDSAASNISKKVTWADIKATLQTTAQADTTAADLAALKVDFNALLAKLRASGLMAP